MTQLQVKGSLVESQKKRTITLVEAMMEIEALVVVDVSSSMSTQDVDGEGGRRSRWEEANTQLAHLQAKFPGKLAVVAFSDQSEFCPSGVLPPTQGGTNMLGALRFVQAADGAGIKFIVVSDGEPDSPDRTLTVAKTMQTPIDSIFIGRPGGSGEAFMKRLSQATKGKSITKGVDLLEQSITLLLTDRKAGND